MLSMSEKNAGWLRKRNKWEWRGVVLSIATATAVPQAELKKSNPSLDASCKRCNAAEETYYHRYWECPANDDIECCGKTQHLKSKVNDDEACLWYRGLLPGGWKPKVATPAEESVWCFDIRGEHAVPCSVDSIGFIGFPGTPLFVAGDGSGGPLSSCPIFRRVGWAWVLMDRQSNLPM